MHTQGSEQREEMQDSSVSDASTRPDKADKVEACKAADIICAYNFSVCLLHQPSEVQVQHPHLPCYSISISQLKIHHACLHQVVQHAVVVHA